MTQESHHIFQVCHTITHQSNPKKSLQEQISESQNVQQNQQKPVSQYLEKYYDFFSEVQQQTSLQILKCSFNQEQLNNYKISIINQNGWDCILSSYSQPFVTLVSLERLGCVATYQIVIGNLRLTLKMLNIQEFAPADLETIGAGGFGNIVQLNYRKTNNFIAKRINFKQQRLVVTQNKQINSKIYPNYKQIQNALIQYSIYKICSFFEIGPKIQSQLGYDLICFIDTIEFYLEKCIRNYQFLVQYDSQKRFVHRLKFCIRLMHRLKIIHKDIKPDNLLYSCTANDYVISDFGISQIIAQQVGQKTLTYKQGTFNYMSDEMKKLKRGQCRLIDLYYNDMFGLVLSIGQLKKFIKSNNTLQIQQIRNIAQKKFGARKNLNLSQPSIIFYISVKILYNTYKTDQELVINKQNLISVLKIDQIIINKIKNFESKLQTQLDKFSHFFEKPSFDNRQYVLQFLIRTIGINYQLKSYLPNIIQKQFIQIMITEISKKKNRRLYDNNISKIKVLRQEQRLEKVLENEFYLLKQKINIIEYKSQIEQIFKELFLLKFKCNENINYCKNILNEIKKLPQNCFSNNFIKYHQIYLQVAQQGCCEQLLSNDKLFNHNKLLQFSQLLYQKHKFKQCLELLNKIDEKMFKKVILMKALTYQKLSEFPSAQIKFLQYIEANISNQLNLVQAYQKYALFLKNKKLYIDSIQNYIMAISILKKLRLQNSPQYSQILSDLGSCYFVNKYYDKSIQLYQESLNIKIKIFSQEYPQNSRIFNNLALVYREKKQFDTALKLNEKALKIRLFCYGEYHFYTACTYINIGLCYLEKCNYEQSLLYFEKAKKIKQYMHGQKNQQMYRMNNYFGELYLKSNKIQEAIQLYKQQYELIIQLFSQKHIYIGFILQQLGYCYLMNCQFSKAQTYFDQSLKITIQNLGINNIEVSQTYNKIGLCYCYQNNFEKAIYFFEKSLQIKELLYKQKNMGFVENYCNLAICYIRINKIKQSIYYQQNVLQIKKKFLGEQSEEVAQTIKNIAYYQAKLQLFQESQTNINKALQIKKNIYGQMIYNQKFLSIYDTLCDIYQFKKDYQKSLQYSLISYQIRLSNKLKLIQMADNLFYIGVIYNKINEFIKAINFFIKCIEICQKFKKKKKFIQCCLSIREIYKKQNKIQQLLMFHEQIESKTLIQVEDTNILLQIYNQTGQLYKQVKNYRNSIQCYMKYIKIIIKNQILEEIIKIYLKLKNYNTALYFLSKIKSPNINSTLCTLKCYILLQKYKKISNWYNKLSKFQEFRSNQSKFYEYIIKIKNVNKLNKKNLKYSLLQTLMLQFSKQKNKQKYKSYLDILNSGNYEFQCYIKLLSISKLLQLLATIKKYILYTLRYGLSAQYNNIIIKKRLLIKFIH